MIPISDDNPTMRTPIVTILILAIMGAAWVFGEGAGLDPQRLAMMVCNYGLVPGEITGRAPVGASIPLGNGLACIVDRDPINYLTPLTSMFLHGGWGHILGNGLFLWIFGNNIEDSMGRGRFVVFYLLCGLGAATAQVLVNPISAVPMVGASGAIAGVLGAYLILYPRVRVNVLFIIIIFIRVISVPAWAMLLWWFGLQLLTGLPQLSSVRPDVSSGVAVFAHIGGFITGAVLIKFFENTELVAERTNLRHRRFPTHP
ncbi:MAG TPA: rhomboid family intramembrane serine protease [Polyangia bacterium]|nr:rhomboid family intramembrane serine protease [Polyangia bacterium]